MVNPKSSSLTITGSSFELSETSLIPSDFGGDAAETIWIEITVTSEMSERSLRLRHAGAALSPDN
jgi:hypothetical protein